MSNGVPQAPGAAPQITNYLWQAIVVTILCCLPFGIPAIVYAAQVNNKLATGDVAGAPAYNRWLPPCPVHELTGWHCPGCGSLRAIHRLLHGDLAGAVRLNVLMVASLPLVGWLMLADLRHRTPPARSWAIWTYFAVVLVYGVLRNLPWEPLRTLAPH